jgi:hypothetical protein
VARVTEDGTVPADEGYWRRPEPGSAGDAAQRRSAPPPPPAPTRPIQPPGGGPSPWRRPPGAAEERRPPAERPIGPPAYAGPPVSRPPPPGWRPPIVVRAPDPRELPAQDLAGIDLAERGARTLTLGIGMIAGAVTLIGTCLLCSRLLF